MFSYKISILYLFVFLFIDTMEGSNPIHYAFPWRALTTRLTHYPPGCSLYDRSLYSLYGNMLNNMTSQSLTSQSTSQSHNLSNLTLNYLSNAQPQSPTNQMSPPAQAGASSPVVAESTSGSASAQYTPSMASAASLYNYRYHPYLGIPKV